MKSSTTLSLLIVSFLLTSSLIFRLIICGLFLFILTNIKNRKEIIHKEVKDIIIGISIIILNRVLTLDFNVINIVVLVVLNTFIHMKQSACKFIDLIRVYWICVLFKGVSVFWANMQ